MECECSDPRFFHRGWRRFFSSLIYNITGYELLDSMSSKKRRGVYIIVVCDIYSEEIHLKYIGSSNDMKRRLYQGKHHIYDKLAKDARDSSYKFCHVLFIDTNKYLDTEKLLIKSLRPELNIQHNG